MRRRLSRVNKIVSIFLFVFLLSCEEKSDSLVKKSYYENGNLSSLLSFNKEGKYDGECMWYYPDGKEKMKVTYKNGVLDGEMSMWYENANMQYKYYYKNDLKDSISEEYNVYGKLVKIENYKDGLRHGEVKQWYDDGSLFLIGEYSEDMLHGKWIMYYQDGTVGSMATYNKGEGIQRGYSQDGHLLTEIHYRDNVKDGEERRYNNKGELVQILLWQNGELIENKNK